VQMLRHQPPEGAETDQSEVRHVADTPKTLRRATVCCECFNRQRRSG
jgi:hypothetical protein